METVATGLLIVLAVYAGGGLLGAAWLHGRALERMDPGTIRAGFWFRLLITPGLVVLWPLMVARARGARTGREILGSVHHPLSAAGTRRVHARLVEAFCLIAPLAVAAALLMRPELRASRVESPPGAPAALPRLHDSAASSSGGIPPRVWLSRDGDGRPQAWMEARDRSRSDTYALYWSGDPTHPDVARAALIGILRGSGPTRGALPPEAAAGTGRLLVYALERDEVAASLSLAPPEAPAPVVGHRSGS